MRIARRRYLMLVTFGPLVWDQNFQDIRFKATRRGGAARRGACASAYHHCFTSHILCDRYVTYPALRHSTRTLAFTARALFRIPATLLQRVWLWTSCLRPPAHYTTSRLHYYYRHVNRRNGSDGGWCRRTRLVADARLCRYHTRDSGDGLFSCAVEEGMGRACRHLPRIFRPSAPPPPTTFLLHR